jgi:CrcB protein
MAFLLSSNVQTVLWISLGSVLGANLRYWLGGWIAQRWGAQFPYATLLINLTGSLIIGFFITLISGRFLVDPRWRIFFAVGFLGSYTTFSTYTYESVMLLMAGNWAPGLFNLFGSALLGALAVILGMALGRLF